MREVEDWDFVSEGHHSFTQRKAVPGGWVYRTVVDNTVAICFVPDANAPAPQQPSPRLGDEAKE